MQEKNKAFLYNFVSILILLPCASRLSVALILYIGVIFIGVFGTLLDFVFKKFASSYAKSIWQIVILVLLCAIYQQIVMLYSPLMEIYTSFSIYLLAFSSFALSTINSQSQESLQLSLKKNTLSVLKFCLYTLVIFIIRDYVGYGTLTLPFCTKLIELNIIHPKIMEQTFFWGSIPFAIILLALIAAGIVFMGKLKNYFVNRGTK